MGYGGKHRLTPTHNLVGSHSPSRRCLRRYYWRVEDDKFLRTINWSRKRGGSGEEDGGDEGVKQHNEKLVVIKCARKY